MRIELARLHQELGITTIYVTHDQAEAMTLSSRLAVMSAGHIQQAGDPDAVYAQPANTFVARFIGSPTMNLFQMFRDGNRLRALEHPDASLPSPPSTELADGDTILAGVRPHDLKVTTEPDAASLPVVVSLTEHLGRNNYVICAASGPSDYVDDEDGTILVETPAGIFFDPGIQLTLTAQPETIRIFTEQGAALEAGEHRPADAAPAPGSPASGTSAETE